MTGSYPGGQNKLDRRTKSSMSPASSHASGPSRPLGVFQAKTIISSLLEARTRVPWARCRRLAGNRCPRATQSVKCRGERRRGVQLFQFSFRPKVPLQPPALRARSQARPLAAGRRHTHTWRRCRHRLDGAAWVRWRKVNHGVRKLLVVALPSLAGRRGWRVPVSALHAPVGCTPTLHASACAPVQPLSPYRFCVTVTCEALRAVVGASSSLDTSGLVSKCRWTRSCQAEGGGRRHSNPRALCRSCLGRRSCAIIGASA